MIVDMYEFWDVVKILRPELSWEEYERMWHARIKQLDQTEQNTQH